MIHPILKEIHLSPDADTNSDNFCIALVLDIGISHENDAIDQFYCSVMSTKALKEILISELYFSGRGCIFMEKFILSDIKKVIEDILSNIKGDTWEQVAHNINKYFPWEYDNYNMTKM